MIDRLSVALSGRYAIEREIGAGGMATVYLARDIKHNRNVALKVLNAELGAVLGTERFLAEIQTTANLQHPHLLPLFDSGEADGLLYFAMPYVEGETLRARLERERQLPVDEALRIAVAIASALDYAHRRNVIHRDLKPENVLLHDGQPLIADFGIALAVSKAGAARVTQTGISLGTPQYMSPEQAAGDRVLDGRTDVYSLGAVLYEMLAGEPPHTGPTAQAIIAKLLAEVPRPVRVLRRSVPAHVEAAVMKSLEKLPADRFTSAGEFAAALQRHDEGAAAGRGIADRRTAQSLFAWRPLLLGGAVGALLLATVVWASRLNREDLTAPPTEWQGELVGGPLIAYLPRISPDGQSLLFQAMVDGLTQLGILQPATGDWTVLTNDRTRGVVDDFTWSADGTRIYFSRFFNAPAGVFSVSPLGGDERLVLEDAHAPRALPDGSLLVARINTDRKPQMHRFWPESGRLEPLGAVVTTRTSFGLYFRVFPDGQEAVFWGHPLSDTTATDHLWTIDLESGATRRLAPGFAISPIFWVFPMAVTPDGRWVLIDHPAGNLHRVLAVPRDGSPRTHTLITLTSGVLGLDVGPDGSLYVDQFDQPSEVLRYSPGNRRLERQRIPRLNSPALPLPDGRVLVALQSVGRVRIMAVSPTGEPVPFIDTREETAPPFAMLGDSQVVFVLGSAPRRTVAIANVATGRIVARIDAIRTDGLTSLAGSPDGDAVYYVNRGIVYGIPTTGGEPRRIHAGDFVAPDPDGRSILVKLLESNAVRLLRVPLDGGEAVEIPVGGDVRVAPDLLAPNAVHPDGRLAFRVASPASWFWSAAILDQGTGRIELVPPEFELDMFGPGWSVDGTLVTQATGFNARIWRFRPSVDGTSR